MPIESSRLFSLLIYSRCSIHRRGLTHFLVLIRWWWIGHRFTNSHHDIARLPQRVLGPESVCKAHLGPQHRFIVAITSSLWKNAISRHRRYLVFASPLLLCLPFSLPRRRLCLCLCLCLACICHCHQSSIITNPINKRSNHQSLPITNQSPIISIHHQCAHAIKHQPI